jgi:hypothetical protein
MALAGKGNALRSGLFWKKRPLARMSLYLNNDMGDIDHSDTRVFIHFFFGTTWQSQTESVALSESFIKRVDKLLADAVALTEARLLTVGKAAADTVSLSEGFSAIKVVFSTVSDTGAWTESLVKSIGKTLADSVALTEARLLSVGKLLTDTVGLTESATIQVSKGAQDAVALAEAIAAAAAKRLDESAGLTEALSNSVTPGGGGAAVARSSVI